MKFDTWKHLGPGTVVWFVYAVIASDQVMLPNATRYLMADLGASVGSVQMALALFSTVAASLYLAAGTAGDLRGRRIVLRAGILMLTAGAATVALAPSGYALLVGWALLRGIGFGLALPNLFAVLTECYEGRQRSIAFASFAAAGSVGATVGPLLMGWAATAVTWRAAFAADVGVLGLCFGLTWTLPHGISRAHGAVDRTGIVLSAVAIGSLILGASLVGKFGWLRAAAPVVILGAEVPTGGVSVVPLLLLMSATTAALLWRHVSRVARAGGEPLFRPHLFRNRRFVTGVLLLSILLYTLASTVFVVPVFLQTVLGFDAIQSGRVTLAFTATIMLGGLLAGALVRRVSIKTLVSLAIPLVAAGFVALYIAIEVGGAIHTFYASMAASGFGVGIVFALAPNTAMSSVEPDERGRAGGLNAVGEEVGVGLGVAVTGSVYLSLGGGFAAFQKTLLVMIGILAVHFVVAMRLPRR